MAVSSREWKPRILIVLYYQVSRQYCANIAHHSGSLFIGEPFTSAAHYFPLNGTNADKKLVDMRGNGSAEAFNGVQASATEQLGTVLKMDGKDDYIEIGGFNNSCVYNPTMCTEGLTVAFWIRYSGGKHCFTT